MSERPWWLPTALFVAPVCGVLGLASGVSATSGVGPRWLEVVLGIVGFLFLPALVIVDLGRREDRYRDRLRPPHLNRWGGPNGSKERPFWRASREALWWLGIIAAVALWAAALIAVPREVRGLFFVVSIVGFIVAGLAILAWSVRRPTPEEGRPFWLKQLVWRWPVTMSVVAIALGVDIGASVVAGIMRGEFLGIIWLPPIYWWLIRGPLRLLRNPGHPERHYGRGVTT